jgi:hypothetical protein
MQATVHIMGKPVRVEWSAAADRQLRTLSEPLPVEMELYFSCLIRKMVRFGRDAEAKEFVAVSPQLKVGFRPIMTKACNVRDFEDEPPVEDFPIVKPGAFVPKRLTIDFNEGHWAGEFFLG